MLQRLNLRPSRSASKSNTNPPTIPNSKDLDEPITAVALFDFQGQTKKELSVKKGETVLILREEKGWVKVKVQMNDEEEKWNTGWLPSEFLQTFPRAKKAGNGSQSSLTSKEAKNLSNEEKEMNIKISFLINSKKRSNAPEDPEWSVFKQTCIASSSLFAQNMDPELNLLSAVYAPTVEYDINKIVTFPLPSQFPINFFFPNKFSKNIRCEGNKTVLETLQQLFRFTHVSLLPKGASVDKYMVKIAGSSEYLDTNIALEQFAFVRESLRKNEQIMLCLVEKTPPLKKVLEWNSHKREKNDFQWLELNKPDHNTVKPVSHLSLQQPFEITIPTIDNFVSNSTDSNMNLLFEGGLYFGNKLLSPSVYSATFSATQQSQSITCNATLKYDTVQIWQIPRGTKLCLTLWIQKSRSLRIPLGWISINLVDYQGYFASTTKQYCLWPNEAANPIGMCVENTSEENPITITLVYSCFKDIDNKIRFIPLVAAEEVEYNPLSIPPPPTKEQLTQLHQLIEKDSLYQLTAEDRELVWDSRYFLRNKPLALAKVLLSIDWLDPPSVAEAQRALGYWRQLEPVDALELLDSRFASPVVREYAARCLEPISDSELSDYCLQLVQALQYEAYHDSPLARLLLTRALFSIPTIGHVFFWHVKAQLHNQTSAERYGLLLEAFLRGCGRSVVSEFVKQEEVIIKLFTVAQDIAQKSAASKRRELLRKHLENLDLPPLFCLPLQSTVIAKGLMIDECRVMDSAKSPLWLVFENACEFGKPIKIIFKSGDDLRQDQLTLQMFRIMDKEWKKEGLDLALSPYLCVATGEAQGMLQVVENAQTIASIQKELGMNGVFKEESLTNWLIQENPFIDREHCVQNFVLSCAGYCVATFCLGIGDRHNDNIMVTKNGHLFHIDFGHFLGNIKKWAGISRERAPFVLTKDFAFVMGGKDSDNFKHFEELCCKAYNIVRQHSNTFIRLFSLMLSTGIPELKSYQDIEYLRRAFLLEEDDTQATDSFKKLIYSSLNTKSTQINFFFHNLAH